MAQSRTLLDAQNIDDIIESVDIEKARFTNDSNEEIDYNRLRITLSNGETIYPKLDKDIKSTIYYALRDSEK